MRPVASFGAMFLWAILLIAVVGFAVSVAPVMWVPIFAWAIVAGGATAGLMRLHYGHSGNTRALKAARVPREHSANRGKNDHT